jgi:hypothetical protein
VRFVLQPIKGIDEQGYEADRSPQSKKQGRFGYEARRLEAINTCLKKRYAFLKKRHWLTIHFYHLTSHV